MLPVLSPVFAQAPVPTEKPRPAPVAQDRPLGDAAVAAMRREVEARRKEQEQNFARLRALPPGQAPEMLVAQQRLANRLVQRARLDANFPDFLPEGRRRRVRAIASIDNLRFVLEEKEAGSQPARVEVDGDGSDEAEKPALPPPILRLQQLVVARECFDDWVFGGKTVDAHRRELNQRLRLQVEQEARSGSLTTEQKEKLLLAGQGDIKRFYEQVEQKRLEFERVRTNWTECQQFARGLRPLVHVSQYGPFDHKSLFGKTLRKILASARPELSAPASPE
jgi:hypothetical protein